MCMGQTIKTRLAFSMAEHPCRQLESIQDLPDSVSKGVKEGVVAA